MSRMKLSRRACLRGLGGATIGLPTLEAMLDTNGTALAAGGDIPKRYVVCFGGHSLGVGSGADSSPNQVVPKTIGRDYDLSTALTPFGEPILVDGQDVNKPFIKNDISVVTGLQIPCGGQDEKDW